jgi:hypothetical protein
MSQAVDNHGEDVLSSRRRHRRSDYQGCYGSEEIDKPVLPAHVLAGFSHLIQLFFDSCNLFAGEIKFFLQIPPDIEVMDRLFPRDSPDAEPEAPGA